MVKSGRRPVTSIYRLPHPTSMMAKPNQIEWPTGQEIPILYEDRSVLAIDKPAGRMLVPLNHGEQDLGLRAVELSYADPITPRRMSFRAPSAEFLRDYGFDIPKP